MCHAFWAVFSRIFTLLTSAITQFCRCTGIRVIFYLDDSFILACSRATAIAHHDFVMSLLTRLGFLINLKKLHLAPTHKSQFLGLDWDSSLPMVALTDDKISFLCSSAQHLLQKEAPCCREIQQFLGRTNFASFALPRARLNSRAIHLCLSRTYKSPSHLFRRCILSLDAKKDLQWWVSFIPIGKPMHSPFPSQFILTDASKVRWGSTRGNCSASSRWPPGSSHHIN